MNVFQKLALLLMLVWMATPATRAQRIDFDALDAFFNEDPKIEVTLKGALLKMGARAAESSDPETAAMMRDIRGIYVRGYPLGNRSYAEANQKMNEIARALRHDQWDVITRVRDDESSVFVMVRETAQEEVEGMLIMVLDAEGDDDDGPLAMFVNIDGRVDPDKIGRLTGNLHINGMEFFSENNRGTHVRIETPEPPEFPRAPKIKVKTEGGADEEDCIERPRLKVKEKCAKNEKDCIELPRMPRIQCPEAGKPGAKDCNRDRIRAEQEHQRAVEEFRRAFEENSSDEEDQEAPVPTPARHNENLNFNMDQWTHPAVQKALHYAELALNLELMPEVNVSVVSDLAMVRNRVMRNHTQGVTLDLNLGGLEQQLSQMDEQLQRIQINSLDLQYLPKGMLKLEITPEPAGRVKRMKNEVEVEVLGAPKS